MNDVDPKRRSWLVVLVGLPVLVVLGVIALVVVRWKVANPYKVPSASMIPTLGPDSHVIVDETDRTTTRGRVIAFKYPEHPDEDFIKRVIGLSGETISQHGTEVSIDGKPIPRCVVGDWAYTDPDAPGTRHSGKLSLEGQGGARWLVFDDAAYTPTSEGPWKVAPGEVFVLGDNRSNSHDSRMWFGGKGGGVPADLVVGAVTGTESPALPKGAEGLQGAFDACMKTLAH